MVRLAFFSFGFPAKLKHYLRTTDLEKVIHAFITSCLDYCNSLYVSTGQSALNHLQLVQNTAARLLTWPKKSEHIMLVLSSLHWLPVRFRIDFMIVLFVFKNLNGLAPEYFSDLVKLPTRALRSADQIVLDVAQSLLKTRGDRAFAVAAPTLWSTLLRSVRSSNSLSIFKTQIKTHLFNLAFD